MTKLTNASKPMHKSTQKFTRKSVEQSMKRSMKKLAHALLLVLLALALGACAATAAPQASGPAQTAAPAVTEPPASGVPATDEPATDEQVTDDEAKTFRIGVIQLAQHAALDAALEGFTEGIAASGLNVTLDVQNAQGEQALCTTIATKFVNDGVDLIMAIATPAAQAAAQATKDIPVLFTAVTDPASAGLVASNDAPGGNVSGTSDMNPVAEQIGLLRTLAPQAKTVGILYNSSEDNSIIQANMARAALEAEGLTVMDFTVSASNEVQAVTQSAIGNADALYIPTDNLMADTITTIAMIATPAGIPLICGESNMVDAGGLATYGISYKQLGLQTAAQAVNILAGGADISTLPVEYCNAALGLSINMETAAALGITIPEELR